MFLILDGKDTARNISEMHKILKRWKVGKIKYRRNTTIRINTYLSKTIREK
jgi:hypothetical protein